MPVYPQTIGTTTTAGCPIHRALCDEWDIRAEARTALSCRFDMFDAMTVMEDSGDVAGVCDVLRGVTVDDKKVGVHAGLESSTVGEMHLCCVVRCSACDCL